MDTTTSGPRGAASLAPKIAVVSQWKRETSYLKVPIPYVHAVELAGGTPTVISSFDVDPQAEIPAGLEVRSGFDAEDASGLADLDGLIVPGGGDVDPRFYQEDPHPRTHSVSRRHDLFEMSLFRDAMARDVPVLAICRGMQLLNVTLGGSLVQHLADSPQLLDHDRDRPRGEPAHKIRLKERSELAAILGSPSVDVNSHHHQGLGRLGAGLEEIAWAEDGVLEAVTATECSWVHGVQWHPEAMAPIDRKQLAIFEAFVDAADAYRVRRLGEIRHARSA